MELRPLGFGEIFDRAITLYIRNFVPFAGIVSVFVIPLAVLQYFLDSASMPQWDLMMRTLEHPGQTPPPPTLPAFLTSPAQAALFIVLILMAWLLWPFALNACTVGVARLYRGRTVEFGACYAASLERWPAVIGLLFLEAAIFIVWYIAFVLGLMLCVLAIVGFAQLGSSLGVGLAVLVALIGLVFCAAGLLLLAPLIVALSFAMNAIVIEGQPAISALGFGFARVFNRREIWRALLFAVAAGTIMVGASMLISAVVLVAMVLHLIVLEVFISSLFRAAVTPFSVVLLAIYYFDVRIRREGFEIEAELDRLADTPRVAWSSPR
ncbi:MAG: hypothetical protein JO302_01620 [Candidatus Eremiobacteraeota bacterium]|nr:hypothetical protein [Candidatus Eremiobacteraeota bacterium]